MIALHKNARTTPAIRAEIAASSETASVLARRFGITEQTVYKWKHRDSVQDRSHTAHRLQTTLTPAQEKVVVELRRTLLLPLDDLLAVTREFICADVSRSGLDRCLRRHEVGNLHALKPQASTPTHKPFKSYEPGYVHVDVKYLPQMQDESRRSYLGKLLSADVAVVSLGGVKRQVQHRFIEWRNWVDFPSQGSNHRFLAGQL